MPFKCWMSILSLLKLCSFLHSRNHSKKRLSSGMPNYFLFQTLLMSGLSVKDSGCTCNQFLILQISSNNFHKRASVSSLWIQIGDSKLVKPNKLQAFLSAVQEKALRKSSSKQTTTWIESREVLPTISRRRDQCSQDSTSSPTTSCLRSSPRPRRSEM